jgi:hypothetical protein
MDLRESDRLGHRERGKDAGKSSGEHRLAGSRRSNQQKIVRPSRGDLKRSLRELLSTHVGQIGLPGWRALEEGARIEPSRLERAFPRKMLHHLLEGLTTQDFHSFHRGSLSGIRPR